MTIKAPFHPIIYVRGYAATMSEIEQTVATPYMGFNLGSTKIRQDYAGDVVRFIFESPLLRLMKDHDYVDTYSQGAEPRPGERVDARSVWIFRYYERVSADLGDGERETIPQFAKDLRRFILNVRDHVCGDDAAERAKFKVYLVAHSMGGLIVRCYLQNICLGVDADLGLPGDPLVDKVFTYATPHNGIDLRGMNVPDLGGLDRLHVRNFNRDVMRKYLNLPEGTERVDSLGDAQFPARRFFCFVGTNYRDYQAFAGLSKKGTGATSDGLVMMRNATVNRAPRAFAHRSHSGHYGIVNSEEGYQNLRRFLFGDVQVDVLLAVDEITLPRPVEKARGEGKTVKAAYHIESSARVRSSRVFLTERRSHQESSIHRTYERLVHDQRPVYLFSGYLMKSAKSGSGTALAFMVHVGMDVPVFEIDHAFWFDEHFEGARLLDETVTFHVRTDAKGTRVRYGLASEVGAGHAHRNAELQQLGDGRLQVEIPIGFREGAAHPPRPGFRGRLIVRAAPWNQ